MGSEIIFWYASVHKAEHLKKEIYTIYTRTNVIENVWS